MTTLAMTLAITMCMRAVPELQELWIDEKNRMKKLLPSNLDFLNYPDDDNSNTTNKNKKEKEQKSGSREAIKGMCNLMSKGLKDDYKKAIRDVTQRCKNELDDEEEHLLLQAWWRKQKKSSSV